MIFFYMSLRTEAEKRLEVNRTACNTLREHTLQLRLDLRSCLANLLTSTSSKKSGNRIKWSRQTVGMIWAFGALSDYNDEKDERRQLEGKKRRSSLHEAQEEYRALKSWMRSILKESSGQQS
jgi:hypothetical protein